MPSAPVEIASSTMRLCPGTSAWGGPDHSALQPSSAAPLFDGDGNLSYFLGSQVDLSTDEAPSLSVRRARAAALVRELPRRQREVLESMAQGLLNKQIAFRLGIAEKTVTMHRVLLLERLGGITSAEAIRIAVEAGL